MNKQGEIIEEIIHRFIDEVREHTDAVQICVSYAPEDEGADTACLDMGSGNWYARVGMVEEFLAKNVRRVQNNIDKEKE